MEMAGAAGLEPAAPAIFQSRYFSPRYRRYCGLFHEEQEQLFRSFPCLTVSNRRPLVRICHKRRRCAISAVAMKALINELRAGILSVEQQVASLKSSIATADLTTRPDVPTSCPAADRGEMIANCMLTYRHLEDARMRLGKVIQAYDGGVSVYKG